jgi:uncharacterized protein
MALLSGKATVVGDDDEFDEVITIDLPEKKHLYYSNGLILVMGAAIIITLWNFTSRSFASLGFIYPKIDQIVILFSSILVISYFIDSYFNFRMVDDDHSKDLEHIMPSTLSDYKHFIFLAFAAGICEEIIFRGFLINYILMNTGNTQNGLIIALFLPAIVFSVSHLYQGWLAVFKIFFFSLLFSAIFIYSNSLLIVIIIHVLVDLISGALMVVASSRK